MSDPAAEAPQEEQTVNVDELALVRVVYKGNASLGDQTGEIQLAPGPEGQSRTLTMGGAPGDALVTPAELHMLTGQFEIEIVEKQPELSEEEVVAQVPPPLDDVGAGQVPSTLPNPNPDAEISAEEAKAAEEAATAEAQAQPAEGAPAEPGSSELPPAGAPPADSPPDPAPAVPAPAAQQQEPQVPSQTPEGDGAPVEQVAPTEPAQEQNPTTTSQP